MLGTVRDHPGAGSQGTELNTRKRGIIKCRCWGEKNFLGKLGPGYTAGIPPWFGRGGRRPQFLPHPRDPMRNPGPHIFKNGPNRGIMWRHIRTKKAKNKQTCKNRACLWCLTLYRTPGFRLALCRERIQRRSRLAALPKKWALTWKRYVITSAKGFYLSRPAALPVIGYFQPMLYGGSNLLNVPRSSGSHLGRFGSCWHYACQRG